MRNIWMRAQYRLVQVLEPGDERMIIRAAATVLALSVLASDAMAQGRGKKGADKDDASVSVSAAVIFTDAHRARVAEYFVAHPVGAKPLPPGIAKNLARGKPMPPGIAKRAVPKEVLVLLPRPEPGVSFVIVGDMVVAERAGITVDVMFKIAR
jgi:hypothetical protein